MRRVNGQCMWNLSNKIIIVLLFIVGKVGKEMTVHHSNTLVILSFRFVVRMKHVYHFPLVAKRNYN